MATTTIPVTDLKIGDRLYVSPGEVHTVVRVWTKVAVPKTYVTKFGFADDEVRVRSTSNMDMPNQFIVDWYPGTASVQIVPAAVKETEAS